MGWKDTFKNVAETAMETVSTAAGSAMGTVTEMAKQAAEDASTSYVNAKEQYNSDKQNASIPEPVANGSLSGGFCTNCGAKLQPGAKFCSGCGTPIEGRVTPPASPIPDSTDSNPETRQQEFAGRILKCPNCGSTISQTTAICPECGYRITGQAAVTSVQQFSTQLMTLESKRKRAGLGQMMGLTADPIDTQKLSLIRSFPIPNTIDDIQEFMMLAIANIDVGLSRNTMTNKWQSIAKHSETSQTMPKTISDAWVAKMQQVYQKAATTFPNDPAFAAIEQVYFEKMKELKIRVDG